MTLEQVCRALNQRCRSWQAERRSTTELVSAAAIIAYHQKRNRAARLSRQRPKPPELPAT